jgi:hypothetical protein
MKLKAIMTLVGDSDSDSDSSSSRYAHERSAFSLVERHQRSQYSILDSPTRTSF